MKSISTIAMALTAVLQIFSPAAHASCDPNTTRFNDLETHRASIVFTSQAALNSKGELDLFETKDFVCRLAYQPGHTPTVLPLQIPLDMHLQSYRSDSIYYMVSETMLRAVFFCEGKHGQDIQDITSAEVRNAAILPNASLELCPPPPPEEE